MNYYKNTVIKTVCISERRDKLANGTQQSRPKITQERTLDFDKIGTERKSFYIWCLGKINLREGGRHYLVW